jgi:hypothetical protein
MPTIREAQRRQEVISLRGKDIRIADIITIASKMKEGAIIWLLPAGVVIATVKRLYFIYMRVLILSRR